MGLPSDKIPKDFVYSRHVIRLIDRVYQDVVHVELHFDEIR